MSFEWQEDYLKLVNSKGYIRVYNLDPTRSLTIDVVSAVNSDYEGFSVADNSRTYGTLADCPLTLPPLDEFYIYGGEGIEASVTLSLVYASNLTTLVPAAISSELDDSGQERIHVANKVTLSAPPAVCAEASGYGAWGGNGSNWYLYLTAWAFGAGVIDKPGWLENYTEDTLWIDFYNDGNLSAYYAIDATFSAYNLSEDSPAITAPASGHGTIYNTDMSKSVCFDWSISGGD